jgi:DNA-binding response OmpR family regulator
MNYEPRTTNYKILVADSSPTIRNIIESLLRKHGYEVLLAEDGAKALEIARLDKPNLILLDNSLPVLSGEQMCKELKQSMSLKDMPVIMLLSKDEIKKEQELKLIGADAFMVKPFSPKEILEQVKNLLLKKEKSPSGEIGGADKDFLAPPPAGFPTEKADASEEKVTQKTAPHIKDKKADDRLDIIEASDLMENFELSTPASEESVHGFQWFLSELQKDTHEDEKTDILPQKKPVSSEKKILDKSAGPIKWNGEKSPFLKHSTSEKISSKLSPADRSEFDQLFSDLKEKISEKIAQEVSKKISREFLEKIIKEEMSKLRKESFSPSEK